MKEVLVGLEVEVFEVLEGLVVVAELEVFEPLEVLEGLGELDEAEEIGTLEESEIGLEELGDVGIGVEVELDGRTDGLSTLRALEHRLRQSRKNKYSMGLPA